MRSRGVQPAPLPLPRQAGLAAHGERLDLPALDLPQCGDPVLRFLAHHTAQIRPACSFKRSAEPAPSTAITCPEMKRAIGLHRKSVR